MVSKPTGLLLDMERPENLGALEIATCLGLVLQGVTLAQGYTYYRHCSRDRLRLKILVRCSRDISAGF